jgi:S-adenosylmethionine hydrolase
LQRIYKQLNHFFLISDFNTQAYQIGSLKQLILKNDPNAIVIDFFHNIRLNNISEAAFIAKNIKNIDNQKHIIVVKVGNTKQWIVYQHLTNYYLLPDNGLITLILDNIDIQNVYSYSLEEENKAIHCIVNNQINLLNSTRNFISLYPRKPFINDHILTAEVIHIDYHGNCYFNLNESTLRDFLSNTEFNIRVQNYSGIITQKISANIFEIADGNPGILFSKNGYLKLVFKMGSAMKLFRIKENTKIIIEKTT